MRLDRDLVNHWVSEYETAWRTSGTDGLTELFTEHASYLHSPYAEPVIGIERIRAMWDEDRAGPDEVFSLSAAVVAVDGLAAVVRAVVRYGAPTRQEYTDLWVLDFDESGRCGRFEEWPFWPGQHWSAREAS